MSKSHWASRASERTELAVDSELTCSWRRYAAVAAATDVAGDDDDGDMRRDNRIRLYVWRKKKSKLYAICETFRSV